MEPNTAIGLLLWGTWVGLDLASIAQVMINRPLVAGTIAGAILGDAQTGIMVGVVLELFALDVLPFGAARYPDYGLGAVAAAAAAVGAPAPGLFGLGLGVVVGLVVAYAGEIGIQLVRGRTSAEVRRHRTALEAGDLSTIYRVHLRGIGRDALRATVLTALGLGLAGIARFAHPTTVRTVVVLSAVATGVGLGTALLGGVRMARGSRSSWTWLATGIVAGTIWVVVR